MVLPDPVFNDTKVSKFVNHLMYDGKKNISYEIFYASLDKVKAKMSDSELSALEIWKKALDNITPQVEVKTMADKLSAEILDAFNNQGGAFKRKEDMHRMAEANRAFAHFRF